MSSPNAKKPASVAENGLLKDCHAGERDDLPHTETETRTQTESLLSTARLIAWGDDLRERLWRRGLVFELCDHDIDFGDLEIEVAHYRRCCKALSWRVEGAT